MKTIVASILDYPKPSLNPLIWKEDQTLKPEVKDFILEFLGSFFAANGFKNPKEWIKDIQFVGSNTTDTYDATSDVDIHTIVDIPKFIEIEKPELSEKEASDFLDSTRKQVDQVKAKIPKTENPIELYFNTPHTSKISTEWSGIYSLMSDTWIEPPHIAGADFDIRTLHPELIELAQEMAGELDVEFGDVKREIKDIKELEETIEAWDDVHKLKFQEKLEKRLSDLDEQINDLVDIREDIVEDRKHYKALSKQEIVFKYLQRHWYMKILTDLKTLVKQSPELSVKDIPVVENIMLQASRHEDSAEGRICIDFDETIAEDKHNGTIGQPEPNAKVALEKLKADGWYIIIYSHRSTTEYGEDQIKEFMDKNDIPYDEIYTEKPNAEFFIDDRAITFTTWNDVLKKVETEHLPEKEANLNIEAVGGRYWVDPSGKIYSVIDTHEGWIYNNTDLLRDNYGLWKNHPEELYSEETDNVNAIVPKMLQDGWARVGDLFGRGRSSLGKGIEIAYLNHIPQSVFDFVSNFDKDKYFLLEDLNKRYVEVSVEELMADGQEAVNRALQREKMKVHASSSWPAAFYLSPTGKLYPVQRTHDEWVVANTELLKKEYGLDFRGVFGESFDSEIGNIMDALLSYGWTRGAIAANHKDYVAQVNDIHKVPTVAIDFFLSGPDNLKLTIEDASESNFVTVTKDELLEGQKGINRAIRMQKQSSKALSKKEATGFNPYGDPKFKEGPAYAIFEHIQPGFGPFPDMEMYTILGNHPMFGSTVQKSKIEELGIPIRQGKVAHFTKNAAFNRNIWLDPKGNEIEVGGATHEDWAERNVEFLQKNYNPNFSAEFAEELFYELLDAGFTRIHGGDSKVQFYMQVAHADSLPTHLNDFVAKYFTPDDGRPLGISDINEETAYRIYDPFPSLEKAIKRQDTKVLSIAKLNKKQAQLGSEYDFSSTHFLLPKEIAEKIIRWAVENIPEDQVVHDSKDPGTKGIQLESHITLKYGLLTDDFEEVKKALDDEKAPHIKFGKSSFFEPEGKDYDVVIIPVESEDLQKLNETLCSQVEHEDLQFKEYHPHVTVAYVEKGLGKEFDGKDIITGEELDLEILTFSPKNGEKRELELGKATEKESSFMPSNTDLAPSNDWSGDVGWPGNEEMDPVWPRDDGENYYSPMDDRPREKSVWWKLLNMFKKQQPMSKKDVVPVKEAEVNKQASYTHAYWIDPNGKVFEVRGDDETSIMKDLDRSNEKTHGAWILRNLDMLQKDYGINPNGWSGTPNSLVEFGWTRIGDAFGTDWGITVKNTDNIPSFVDDVIAQFAPEGSVITVATPGSYGVNYTFEWPVKSIQQTVQQIKQRREYYQKQPVHAKQAKQWTTPTEHVNQPGMAWGWADYIYNYVDENWQDLLHDWLNLDPKNYVKPAVIIEKIYKDEGAVSAWVHIEFINTAGNSDAYMKLIITANIEGSESIEPEGREFHQDLTDWEIDITDFGKTDELEKSSSYGPTNYQGPSVADHGYQNSAWDDMNVTYSPEEDEKFLDQNGADGYPNRWMGRHRGPYYTDEGKVIKMLEDTKPQKQAAYRGNLDLWLAPDGQEFSIHRSHKNWIVDETNLLNEDYDLMVPAEGTPEGNDLVSWLISKDWIRVTGILPNELDLTVFDIHKLPPQVEQFVWKYKPEVVILEDLKGNDTSFDKEEYSKGLMQHASLKFKADISGQTINEILHLIQTTGGATYSFSKGNLVGTDGYAVAIYPQREQIANQVDYDTIEGYLTQNEYLLSNSNNSFGAWISGGNKVYLDIVAVIKDLNEAMELGRKHNQLAIFNLKTLQEIPIQKLAKLAAAVSDRQQQKYYDEIYSDRWRDDSSRIDGGNEYYDWSELGSNDFPNPKDEEKEHVYMDLLEDPAKSNFPAGLPEYWVTFYDSNPNIGDQGGI